MAVDSPRPARHFLACFGAEFIYLLLYGLSYTQPVCYLLFFFSFFHFMLGTNILTCNCAIFNKMVFDSSNASVLSYPLCGQSISDLSQEIVRSFHLFFLIGCFKYLDSWTLYYCWALSKQLMTLWPKSPTICWLWMHRPQAHSCTFPCRFYIAVCILSYLILY